MSQRTAQIAEFTACLYCRKPVTEPRADLCDECWKVSLKRNRQHFPRRSGRTLALIQRLVPGGNLQLLIPFENYARDLQRRYPDLRQHIHSPYSAKRLSVERGRSDKWLIDHHVYEIMSDEVYDLLRYLELADG